MSNHAVPRRHQRRRTSSRAGALILMVLFSVVAYLVVGKILAPSKPDPVGNCANALTADGVIHHQTLDQALADPLCRGLTYFQREQAIKASTQQMGGN